MINPNQWVETLRNQIINNQFDIDVLFEYWQENNKQTIQLTKEEFNFAAQQYFTMMVRDATSVANNLIQYFDTKFNVNILSLNGKTLKVWI